MPGSTLHLQYGFSTPCAVLPCSYAPSQHSTSTIQAVMTIFSTQEHHWNDQLHQGFQSALLLMPAVCDPTPRAAAPFPFFPPPPPLPPPPLPWGSAF